MRRLFVVVSLVVVLVGLLGGGSGRVGTAAQDATPTADLEANKALARRFHDEIFEQGNLAVADEILTPDFVWHAPPQTIFCRRPRGRQAGGHGPAGVHPRPRARPTTMSSRKGTAS